MSIPTNPDRFSYFLKPVKNITPCRTISLETVYHFISMEYLRSITARIKSGTSKRFRALPFITPSAVFQKRAMEYMLSYSGIIPFDLDDVDIELRYKLFEDPFLNPKLLFVNPFCTGLKLFIKVKNPSAEHHEHYCNAIVLYLKARYELEPLSPGRDLYRPCYLSYDPEALYSESGCVNAETLMGMIPPMPCTDEQMYITHNPANDGMLRKFCTDARPCVSTPLRDFHIKNSRIFLYNNLNTVPAVHDHAVSLLRKNGWTHKGKYWHRPGSAPEETHSAIFARFAPYGIFLFTNFSENAPPFLPNKSYSDCMIINTFNPQKNDPQIHTN